MSFSMCESRNSDFGVSSGFGKVAVAGWWWFYTTVGYFLFSLSRFLSLCLTSVMA